MTEEKQEKSEVYQFEGCVVDADLRELTLAGQPVTLQPKAFELLLFLIRNRHRAVDKDELQDALWPRSIVTETALTRCVMKARRAVGDDADKQAIIKTVHGHGYRFTAEVKSGPGSSTTAEPPVPEKTTRPARGNDMQPFKIVGTMLGLFAVMLFAWLYFATPALSGPVRLAIIPVENATGDPDLAWVSDGLVALMSRMLEDSGIETVSPETIASLAGNTSQNELIAKGSDFRQRLEQVSAATHIISARIEDAGGLYRLTYTLSGVDKRPTRRTMVGKEPGKLIRDVVDTVVTLILQGSPIMEKESSVSQDDFLNEAYARAMSLFFEGRYQDAKNLFEMIIEQEPHLFWPRYERALTIRNLRDYETAERELVELRLEASRPGMEKELSSVENALGIIYWEERRHDEAREVFQKSVDLALEAGNVLRAATGYQNLGLVEKNVNNIPQALAFMQKAEQTFADADIKVLPGALLNNMSGVLIQMGNYEKAQEYSLRAVDSFQLSGERRNEASAMNRLADIYARRRFYDEAENMAESALSVRRELGDQYGVGSSFISLADIAGLRGDYTRGLQFAMQARDIAAEIDSSRLLLSALIRMGRGEFRLGNNDAAIERFNEVEAVALNTEDPHNVFRARMGVAAVHIDTGSFDEAIAVANEMQQTARDAGRRREETAAMRIIAEVYSSQGRHLEAIVVLEEVFAYAVETDDTVVQASLHFLLAREHLALGDTQSATPHVEQAAIHRPEDAASLKVQAELASQLGDAADAVRLMQLARTNAGQSWTSDDDATLSAYEEDAALADQ